MGESKHFRARPGGLPRPRPRAHLSSRGVARGGAAGGCVLCQGALETSSWYWSALRRGGRVAGRRAAETWLYGEIIRVLIRGKRNWLLSACTEALLPCSVSQQCGYALWLLMRLRSRSMEDLWTDIGKNAGLIRVKDKVEVRVSLFYCPKDEYLLLERSGLSCGCVIVLLI